MLLKKKRPRGPKRPVVRRKLPWKLRTREVEYQLLARREGRLLSTLTWDPACEVDPVTNDQASLQSARSEKLPPITVQSNFIRYTNSNKIRFNPCYHVRKRLSSKVWSLILDSKFEWSSTREFTGCSEFEYISDVGSSNAKLRIDLAPGDLGVLLTDAMVDSYLPWTDQDLLDEKTYVLDQIALRAMYPKLDTGFTLPVFLKELGDVKHMAEEVWSVAKLFSSTKNLKAMWSKLLDTIAGDLSNKWLSLNFGWIPFVADVKKIVTKFRYVGKVVDDFLLRKDRFLRIHFKKNLSPLTFRDEAWFKPVIGTVSITTDGSRHEYASGIFDTLELTYLHERKVENLSYNSTMVYYYTVSEDELVGFQRVLAELDYWGLHLSISDLWNMVPFSFVLDWVWNVTTYLKRFDFSNLDIQVRVCDFCRSYKFKYTETLTFDDVSSLYIGSVEQVLGAGGWVLSPDSTTFSREEVVYWRTVGIPLPSSEHLPNMTLPSGKSFVSLSALANQAYLKRRKKSWKKTRWKKF